MVVMKMTPTLIELVKQVATPPFATVGALPLGPKARVR